MGQAVQINGGTSGCQVTLPLDSAPTKPGSGHSSPPSSAGVLSRTMASIGATNGHSVWPTRRSMGNSAENASDLLSSRPLWLV